MRSFGHLVLITLTHLAALIAATPLTNIIPSPLSPRAAQPTCDNSNTTIAGTLLTSPGPISPSAAIHATNGLGVTWCASGSQTYIHFGVSARTTDPSDPLYVATSTLLSQVADAIAAHIESSGDGVMNKGGSLWQPGAVDVVGRKAQVVFVSQNAPEGKVSWGVLGAAVGALRDYFGGYGVGLVGYFVVYDGGKEVGTGSIEAVNVGGG